MSATLVTLSFKFLQVTLVLGVVESLSCHFIDVCHDSRQAPSRRLISSVASRFIPMASSIQYRRGLPMFSSRHPNEETDDGYDDFSAPRFSEISDEEIRLRRMAKSTPNEFPGLRNENFQVDDRDFDERDRRRGGVGRKSRSRGEQGPRNGSLVTYDDPFDEYSFDEDFYDDEDFDDEEPTAGNFWVNPMNGEGRNSAGIVGIGRARRRRRYYDEDDFEDDRRRYPGRSRGRRRLPVPSNLRQAPQVFKSLYDQLFWYGFDIDDNAKVGDNNVFGGTKGKFNGFNYLLEMESESKKRKSLRSNSPVRRLPSARNEDERRTVMIREGDRTLQRDLDDNYYYNDDGDNYDDYYNNDDSMSDKDSSSKSLYTPPVDESQLQSDSTTDYDTYENYEYEDDVEYTDVERMGGRMNKSVRYNDEDVYMDRRSGGRRRRRQKNGFVGDWSPLDMVESLLRIDKEKLSNKADAYNTQMGLGKRRWTSSTTTFSEGRRQNRINQPPRRSRSAKERRGFAYRYDATEDDEPSAILDIDLAIDEDPESTVPNSRRQQRSVDDTDAKNEKKTRNKEQSWEERQIAMERVPPIDIMAWGPSGELPVSAREKAFTDAQEDIETAKRKVKQMKKKESGAKEEIMILKVDAERQRLKLSESPRERRSHRDVEELRQIEMEIDDASRNLRRSRRMVERALEQLEVLEERHYAIMSCYNIEKASLLVGESLNEFSTSIQGTSNSSSNGINLNVSDENNSKSETSEG